MDKDVYNHLHGYQDRKDAFNLKLDALASELYETMWNETGSILEALSESLSESDDYAALVKYCRANESMNLLGVVTLELIDIYLSEKADELAEDELT